MAQFFTDSGSIIHLRTTSSATLSGSVYIIAPVVITGSLVQG